jgi:alkylation response protein AidB-like acyl-CoA dehydrogenase
MEVAMAKAWTSQAYRRVATLGHQLFGGIGLMREHDMHLYMRRGRRDAIAFGDATEHLDRLAGILEERRTPWPE